MTTLANWRHPGGIGVLLVAAALLFLVGGLAPCLDDEPVASAPAAGDAELTAKAEEEKAYPLEDFSIVFKNNIFDSNRRPERERRQPREQAPPPPRAEHLDLIGVMIYEEGAVAFFEASNRSFSGPCEQGMEIAGLFLMDIQTDRVTLAKADFETVLPVGSRLGKRGDEEWQVQQAPYRGINRKALTSLSDSRNRDRGRNNRGGRGGNRGRGNNNRGRGNNMGNMIRQAISSGGGSGMAQMMQRFQSAGAGVMESHDAALSVVRSFSINTSSGGGDRSIMLDFRVGGRDR